MVTRQIHNHMSYMSINKPTLATPHPCKSLPPLHAREKADNGEFAQAWCRSLFDGFMLGTDRRHLRISLFQLQHELTGFQPLQTSHTRLVIYLCVLSVQILPLLGDLLGNCSLAGSSCCNCSQTAQRRCNSWKLGCMTPASSLVLLVEEAINSVLLNLGFELWNDPMGRFQ